MRREPANTLRPQRRSHAGDLRAQAELRAARAVRPSREQARREREQLLNAKRALQVQWRGHWQEDKTVETDVLGNDLGDINKDITGRKRRPVPAFDLKLLGEEMELLRQAGPSNDDKVLRRVLPDQSEEAASRPALDRVCVPTSVGGHELVGDAAYQEQAQKGYAAAASKGIVFAGLMRDVGDSVGPLIRLLQETGKAFARHHTIIIENNSKDSTKANMAKECAAKHVSCFHLDIKSFARKKQGQGNPSRVRHFTALRQVLLEKVRRLVSISDTGPSSWDYLVLFDGDLLEDGSQGFDPSSLYSLLGFQPTSNGIMATTSEAGATPIFAESPWDVVCANQLANWPEPGRYRDVFALRNLSSWNTDYFENLKRDKYFKGNAFVQVKSCFSGMGLYSMRTIIDSGCNYTYEAEEVCEHVVFHKCLARQGYHKLAIYPPLAIRVNDHGVVRLSCANMSGPAVVLAEPNLPVHSANTQSAPSRMMAHRRRMQIAAARRPAAAKRSAPRRSPNKRR